MELVRPARNWYDDRQRLADLADRLKEQGREPDDWGYFIRKPWKWTLEFRDMEREEREAEMERLANEERDYEREGRYWPGGDAA